MLKLSDLYLDVERIFDGSQILAEEPVPYYTYKDGKKTDDIEGYRYMIVLPNLAFEKVSVKVPGKLLI